MAYGNVARPVAALVALLLLGGCTGDGEGVAGEGAAGPRGPLCPHLPSGDDPGSPASIAGQTLDEAVAANPVLTVFGAAAERTGLAARLRDGDGLTVMAPIDDAFYQHFDDDAWDDLMVRRTSELDDLLAAHVLDERLDLDGLLDAGQVVALDGTVLEVEQPYGEGVAHVGSSADVLCADLEAANGTIHVLDAVMVDGP